MNENGKFNSEYMLDGKPYSWRGDFESSNKTYIERRINNSGETEHNEAHLYYIPALDQIGFKGIQSLDYVDKYGKNHYIIYEVPEFYYFKRCADIQK